MWDFSHKNSWNIPGIVYINKNVLFILPQKMDFSLMVEWTAMTGSITPEALDSISNLIGVAIWGATLSAMLISILAGIFMIIVSRRVLEKAKLPGRWVLIPVYNIVLFFQLGGMSGRWTLALLFPPLLRVVAIVNIFNITKKFWKHWTFGLGLIFFELIFVAILAFDKSKYQSEKIITAKPVAKPIAKPITKIATKPAVKKTATPAKKVVKKAPAKKIVKKVKTLTKKK